jgi:large subunit ribosomal protein L18
MAKIISSAERRKNRVRYAIKKNGGGRVRLSVHRSGKHIYAQLIDDAHSVTVAAASTLDKAVVGVKSTTVEAAAKVGALIAERAKGVNVQEVVFDRGGHIFHGRIKALAEGARAAGLKF